MLVLGMRVGDRVFVGDQVLELQEIFESGHCRLNLGEIHRDRMVELIPDVFVGLTLGGSSGEIKLQIDAPRSIEIVREKARASRSR